MWAVARLLVRAAPWVFVQAVFFSVLAGAANVAVLVIVNGILAGRAFGLHSYFFLCLLALVTATAAGAILVRLSQDVLVEFRLRLSRAVLHAPLRAVESLGAGRVLVVLTDDVTAVGSAAAMLPTVAAQLAAIIGCFGYLAYLSPRGIIWVFGALAIGVMSYYAIIRPAIRRAATARARRDALFTNVRALIEGVKELKLHRRKRDDFLRADIGSSARAVRDSTVFANFFYIAAANWGRSLFFLAIGFFLFGADTFGIRTGIVSGYVLTILFMQAPVESIIVQVPILGAASVSVERLNSIGISLDEEPAAASPVPEPPAPSWGRLDLTEIVHGYFREGEPSTFRLGPIHLTLQPGRVLFLVGGNGSGKSTLAKVVTGLYTPESGDVRLDGERIDESNREWYRQHFSAVFADYYLFDGIHGWKESDLARAEAYLKLLRLDGKVRVEGGRFSTTALSSGQRKRLALLIALLEDRPIYVFDEWTSDQDPAFKRIFYLEILTALKAAGKAVLVISHDDRYFHVADEILKLEDGQQVSESTGDFIARLR